MSTQPLDVTILMPVYNGAAFLEEALAGVLGQTVSSWRLLAIDDASTDGSVDILSSVADSRVTVMRNRENLGLYGTLARGIALLDTEWIVIAMQDDRLHARYLDEMTRLAAGHRGAEAFWVTEHLIDAAGARVATRPDSGRVEVIPPGKAPWANAMAKGCLWTISGSLTRRRVFQDLPLRVDLPHCGDFDWFLRAVRAREFVYLERPLVDLRLHQGQATTAHRREGRNLAETFAVIDQQLREHPGDMPGSQIARVGVHRAGQCLHLLAGNVLRGDVASAPRLAVTAMKFLSLPWRAAFRRAAPFARPITESGHDAGRR